MDAEGRTGWAEFAADVKRVAGWFKKPNKMPESAEPTVADPLDSRLERLVLNRIQGAQEHKKTLMPAFRKMAGFLIEKMEKNGTKEIDMDADYILACSGLNNAMIRAGYSENLTFATADTIQTVAWDFLQDSKALDSFSIADPLRERKAAEARKQDARQAEIEKGYGITISDEQEKKALEEAKRITSSLAVPEARQAEFARKLEQMVKMRAVERRSKAGENYHASEQYFERMAELRRMLLEANPERENEIKTVTMGELEKAVDAAFGVQRSV